MQDTKDPRAFTIVERYAHESVSHPIPQIIPRAIFVSETSHHLRSNL